MFSRFQKALFGIPFLASAPSHTFTGPTTQSAIAAAQRSASMATTNGQQYEIATVANGCYWGTQHEYTKHFGDRLKATEVGFTGGHTDNPTYRQTCTGTTGHAEACKITFEPSKISYAEIIEFFFRTHDPTQVDGQGPDRGTQYRSAIFYHSPEQKEIAEQVAEEIKSKHPQVIKRGGFLATEIIQAGKWYTAERMHQNYLDLNPSGYACPTHRMWW